MSVGQDTADGGVDFLKVTDDTDRIRTVVQSAIDNGRRDGVLVRFGIPVEPDLSYWGRGEWYIPEDGNMPGRANVLFGVMLSTIMDRTITVSGSMPAEVAEGQESHSLLLATTVEI
jgi:hypothetical protein